MVLEFVAALVWLVGAAAAAHPGIPPARAASLAVGVGSVGIAAAVGSVALRWTTGAGPAWFAVLAAVFVAGLSVWIQRFAVAHLRGDTGQRRFVVWVNVLTAAAVGLVLAPSVLWFAVAWTVAGAALIVLLATYRRSRQARDGVARALRQLAVGDLALWAAVVTVSGTARGDVEWARLAAVTERLPAWSAAVVALLLVVACVSRSAQFPLDGWLRTTLAAPTPVSAVMHAGLVNAAAFLVIRFAPMVTAHPAALALLGACGAASMVVGSAGYLVRADLKGRLVASTTAQMGVMLVTLSVGAWGAAVFHLVGHGMYKARLFLRAGEQVDDKRRALATPVTDPAPAAQRRAAAVVATVLPGLGIVPAAWLSTGPATLSSTVLAASGWVAAALVLHSVLTNRGVHVGVRVLAVPLVIVASAVYTAAVHALDALVSSDVPAAVDPLPGWVLVVPLLVVGALSLLPHLPIARDPVLYGWVARVAGTPVPRLRLTRRSTLARPTSTSPVQETA
ncbi:proton-conducting transporter membrane subunit [Curtobacterium sp. MCBA15_004]|uniref:proton-conducting transporter transmembrane domain-containing protein n=1 Tax=unclassified Curtobacterium TaxID=257496 RepID=UPI0008DE9774|nr:proton-conducting transporter membrane subunit [Curtobacterium sp. MCBA15_004]WIA98384.1 proton-conducting transporter membrane subunit [Curtobacterium sp. MCBA15_004]